MSFKAGDKVKCIDNGGVAEYLTLGDVYDVDTLSSGGFPRINSRFYNLDRFELIEKEDTMDKPMQFNPKSGDKIICNNGEEFSYCTLEYLKKEIAQGISCCDPILGYDGVDGWCSWTADGTCGISYPEWSIREVIPLQDEEKVTVFKFDKNTGTTDSSTPEGYTQFCTDIHTNWDGSVFLGREESIRGFPLYSLEDIRKACIVDLGWHKESVKLLMNSLEKVTNSEYKEYLRLKAMFEGE